ncbi:hypothetical protein [Stutzerimonas kunmingensis]|jgi:hypothetical protein|uniref:hypothetical protein n=1 Tax=Stutzerimonas kunmingensis TaxID=1211807 RepID=UPI0028B25A9B|nr:hypothetical protein [Stutzerimonas kunmingensis]
MRVKPIGELVFEKDGHKHHIAANQLLQGELKKEAEGLHGESEDWSVIFTANSAFGNFAWCVSYTLGNEELDVSDSERVKTPDGVKVIRDVSFKSA